MKKQTYDRAYPTIDLSEIKPSKFWEQSDERFKHKEALKQAISLLKQTTEYEVLDSWKQKVKELEQFKKK
jgi:hypothetical protein